MKAEDLILRALLVLIQSHRMYGIPQELVSVEQEIKDYLKADDDSR